MSWKQEERCWVSCAIPFQGLRSLTARAVCWAKLLHRCVDPSHAFVYPCFLVEGRYTASSHAWVPSNASHLRDMGNPSTSTLSLMPHVGMTSRRIRKQLEKQSHNVTLIDAK